MSLSDRLVALPEQKPLGKGPGRVDDAAAAVRAAYPGYAATKVADLDVLVRKLEASVTSATWESLTEGQFATIVRAWAAREIELGRRTAEFVAAELSCCTRPSILGALCEGFIAGWAADQERTAEAATLIVERSASLPMPMAALLRSTPELLDLENGPARFGEWLAAQRDPYESVLKRGIAAPHGPGFMEHVHRAWLSRIPTANNLTTANRVLDWIDPSGHPKLTGDRAAAAVAHVLKPWHEAMPSEDLRASLLKRLTDAFGDPRRDREHFWSLVGERGRRVMLRWLAGRRMEAFLEIVSKAEAGGTHQLQWAKRRQFWMGMYQQGRVDEAWVALTGGARLIAEQLYAASGDEAYRSYGLQVGSRKDTCLLVMRVGRRTLVEGSHNFRVHLFEHDNEGAPALYAPEYDIADFILPDPHPNARVHDSGGNWMDWVRDRTR